jgi:long-chain fatty acid transport protein
MVILFLILIRYPLNFHMIRLLLLLHLFTFFSSAYGTLSGGRPNAFSEGINAFAGVVNPANAVWIEDRFDIQAAWIHQKSTLDNHNNNPLFPPGKTDLTYKAKDLYSADIAIHKQFKSKTGSRLYEYSLSFAYYSTPTRLKLRTKKPIPLAGTTPIFISDDVQVYSLIFSQKLNRCHSIGISADYFDFSHLRNGFQNSDNPARSVSPGHVTNNGTDHSHGIGLTVGWRWKITKSLDFGVAWIKKSYCGQYRKYRGFEPHHAKNYVPQGVGGGFTYRFNSKLAGRLEVLWLNLGNLPNSNNNVLPNGRLNRHKRGSSKSPGPGLQDATFISAGLGYKWNSMISVGGGFSHRIKLHRSSNFLSHTYTLQTIYNVLTLGTNIRYKKHDLFLVASYGFKNRVTGYMPIELGGGKFTGEKENISFSFSWGYLF